MSKSKQLEIFSFPLRTANDGLNKIVSDENGLFVLSLLLLNNNLRMNLILI